MRFLHGTRSWNSLCLSEEAHASIHYDLTVSNKTSSSRVFSCKIITDEKGYACAALIVGVTLAEYDNNQRRKRSKWTENWLLDRNQYGSYSNLYRELSLEEN